MATYNTLRMKKYFLFFALVSVIILGACKGKAAEDRAQMHARAKVIADSMANLIRSAMAEAEMPGYQPPVKVGVDTTAQKTNTTVNTPKK